MRQINSAVFTALLLRSTDVIYDADNNISQINVSFGLPYDLKLKPLYKIPVKMDVNDMKAENLNSTEDGGGFEFNNPGTFVPNIRVWNMSYINCSSTKIGGAMYFSNLVSIAFDNSSFINSTGTNGGSVGVNLADEANMNYLFVENSNSTTGSGGAIQATNVQNMTLSNSIMKNTWGTNGGSMHFTGGLFSFVNNNVQGSGCKTNGGSLYIEKASNVLIKDTNYLNCSANNGGNYYFHTNCINVTIDNCNHINSSSINDGGCIYSNSKILFLNASNFANCESSSKGGGGFINLPPESKYTIINCLFQYCSSKSQGGAMYWSSVQYSITIRIIETTFSNCSSAEGGAIYSQITGSSCDLAISKVCSSSCFARTNSKEGMFSYLTFTTNTINGLSCGLLSVSQCGTNTNQIYSTMFCDQGTQSMEYMNISYNKCYQASAIKSQSYFFTALKHSSFVNNTSTTTSCFTFREPIKSYSTLIQFCNFVDNKNNGNIFNIQHYQNNNPFLVSFLYCLFLSNSGTLFYSSGYAFWVRFCSIYHISSLGSAQYESTTSLSGYVPTHTLVFLSTFHCQADESLNQYDIPCPTFPEGLAKPSPTECIFETSQNQFSFASIFHLIYISTIALSSFFDN